MCDDFGKSQVGCLDVKVPFNDLKIRRDLSKEIVRFLIGQVAQTQDLADFAGSQEFFEL